MNPFLVDDALEAWGPLDPFDAYHTLALVSTIIVLDPSGLTFSYGGI